MKKQFSSVIFMFVLQIAWQVRRGRKVVAEECAGITLPKKCAKGDCF